MRKTYFFFQGERQPVERSCELDQKLAKGQLPPDNDAGTYLAETKIGGSRFAIANNLRVTYLLCHN